MRFASLLLLAASACTLPFETDPGSDEITSVEGSEFAIDYQSFVYVPAGAGDDVVRREIQRQIKSSLGALREVGVGVLDRDAHAYLQTADWTRTPLQVVDADGTPAEAVERVTFHYRDTALVDDDTTPASPMQLTLLFGDYAARRDELVPDCSDDADAEADSLWYHYAPGRWACRNAIAAERDAINAANAALADASVQISRADRDRRFVTTLATLVPAVDPPDSYPEYDRLWGFSGNTSRTKLVVYAFFGVDRDRSDPGDYGLRELMRFQKTLRKRFPSLQVTHTQPFAMLLDFWIDGARVEGVSFDDVQRWILDNAGFPAAANTAARRAALKQQVVDRFSERWIYWTLPVTVTLDGASRDMTVEIRAFYGYEDGSWEARRDATWRYLEAFWHADVFAYTGHSHFGHGPLEPTYYHGGNFPWRYQVMLVNSCLSFNYYDQDFLDMHPGGSANLDIVTNGLAAYWHGMGEAAGKYVIALVDGENKTWRQVLASMRVDVPWEAGYDPMRAVNGELDNAFAGAIHVAPVRSP
jgi:hypothetical protein